MSPSDDVGVVDEVQMMEDVSRGGAWTRAILGELAKPCLPTNSIALTVYGFPLLPEELTLTFL